MISALHLLMLRAGSAAPDGPYLASPQEAVSPGPIDDLWDKALDNYGLVRPTEVTEIHVFRVILQSSWDKNACTRTVTRTDPRDDPFQTLTRIIGEWPDLELEEQHQCIAPVRGPQPMNFPPLPMC